jgi:hypothetical protein
VGKVVEQRASNRGLTDTTFVCAYQYNCGLCHDATPNTISNDGEASTAEWDKSWQDKSKEEIKEPIWYGNTCGVLRLLDPRFSNLHKPSFSQALATDVLHRFPFFECGFDRQKVCMFAILRVFLDGSACSRESATSGNAESSLTKNLRQRFGELLIVPKCRWVCS